MATIFRELSDHPSYLTSKIKLRLQVYSAAVCSEAVVVLLLIPCLMLLTKFCGFCVLVLVFCGVQCGL